MLVITRKIGERIIIGDEVKVAVLSIRGNQVRLGIVAPQTTRIDREEIRDQRELVHPVVLDSQDEAFAMAPSMIH